MKLVAGVGVGKSSCCCLKTLGDARHTDEVFLVISYTVLLHGANLCYDV